MSEWQQRQLERRARFWELIRKGWTNTAACEAVGVERRQGYRWRKAAGGRIPGPVRATSGRYLSLEERLAIADLHLEGRGVRDIAAALNRAPSTISRELQRNGSMDSFGSRSGRANLGARGVPRRRRYAPYAAQKHAELRARRPKGCKLDHPPLVAVVEDRLKLKWSPEQIRDELCRLFPDQPEMQVSHETIYQSLFVQGRGHLRADLHKQLRTGRAMRRPRGSGQAAKANLTDVISISERPAEAEDRAVPGHWEGDLILGTNCRSAIGTLVERSTRFVILVPLPGGHTALEVRDALIPAIKTLPEQLRRSLTWDRGTEMARHRDVTLATDMAIYFADPHSPWQRGSNENTNGLLRQYFPKGTDLSVHGPRHVADVAAELNARPRRTLGGITPAVAPPPATVALDPRCDDRLKPPFVERDTSSGSLGVWPADCAAVAADRPAPAARHPTTAAPLLPTPATIVGHRRALSSGCG